MDVLACILSRIERDFREHILPFVFAIIILGLVAALVVLITTLDPAGALATFLATLFAALIALLVLSVGAIISAIISCVIAALSRAVGDVTGANPAAGQALTAVDCPSAQAALVQAESAFTAAVVTRDSARTGAVRARRRGNAASQGLITALFSIVAAPFFRPDLLLAAIAVAIAASLLLFRRLRQLALAEALLADAEAALIVAAAQLGAAQALVDQFCGQGGQPPIGTVNLGVVGGGLTT